SPVGFVLQDLEVLTVMRVSDALWAGDPPPFMPFQGRVGSRPGPGASARRQTFALAPRASLRSRVPKYANGTTMCRNIRTLFNSEPPATEEEIRASARQFVRKLSGFTPPSRANAAAFDRAVDEVSAAARKLLDALETTSPPRDRETEAAKARAR